jgi:poly(A) polymerase
MNVMSALADAGFSSYLAGPSSLNMYHARQAGAYLWIETEGSLVDVSRLFEDLLFPGSAYFDAALELDEALVLFHCIEPDDHTPSLHASLQGTFRYDIRRRVFLDSHDAYHAVRGSELVPFFYEKNDGASPSKELPGDLLRWYRAGETALLAANHGYEPKVLMRLLVEAESKGEPGRTGGRLTPLEQRFFLAGVLVGPHAAEGLSVLMESGFIAAHWPLLAAMNEVHHSKEHHPEGNVWKHTMEAFTHRKVYDLPLSLGLLLHDCGKPFSHEENGNRFDRHAQIGAYKARRFLEQLQFPPRLVDSVEFLVGNHMFPGAVSRLPIYRTEKIMSSSLFPELLELYRCDISSTYRGPEGYYQACRAYRNYLKHSHNPFRTSDGKKRLRLLVE